MDEKIISRYIDKIATFTTTLTEKENEVMGVYEKAGDQGTDLKKQQDEILNLTYNEFLSNSANGYMTEEEFANYKQEKLLAIQKAITNYKGGYWTIKNGLPITVDENSNRLDEITEEINASIKEQSELLDSFITMLNNQIKINHETMVFYTKEIINAKNKNEKVRLGNEYNKIKQNYEYLTEMLENMKKYRRLVRNIEKLYNIEELNYDASVKYANEITEISEAIAKYKNNETKVNYDDFKINIKFNPETNTYQVQCKCGNVSLVPAKEFTKEELTPEMIQKVVRAFSKKVAENGSITFDELQTKNVEINYNGEEIGKVPYDRVGEETYRAVTERSLQQPQPDQPTPPQPQPEPPTPLNPDNLNPIPPANKPMQRAVSARKALKTAGIAGLAIGAAYLFPATAPGIAVVGGVYIAVKIGKTGLKLSGRIVRSWKHSAITRKLERIANSFDLVFDKERSCFYEINDELCRPIDATYPRADEIQAELDAEFENHIRGLGAQAETVRERLWKNAPKVTVDNLIAAYIEFMPKQNEEVVEQTAPEVATLEPTSEVVEPLLENNQPTQESQISLNEGDVPGIDAILDDINSELNSSEPAPAPENVGEQTLEPENDLASAQVGEASVSVTLDEEPGYEPVPQVNDNVDVNAFADQTPIPKEVPASIYLSTPEAAPEVTPETLFNATAAEEASMAQPSVDQNVSDYDTLVAALSSGETQQQTNNTGSTNFLTQEEINALLNMDPTAQEIGAEDQGIGMGK